MIFIENTGFVSSINLFNITVNNVYSQNGAVLYGIFRNFNEIDIKVEKIIISNSNNT